MLRSRSHMLDYEPHGRKFSPQKEIAQASRSEFMEGFVLREAPTHAEDREEELYFSGCHVVWTSCAASNVGAHKTFTTNTPVVTALLCHLTGADPASWDICIAEKSCLTIHAANGDVFDVVLPFEVASVFALDSGILICRLDADPLLPRVFSLMHPLEEVKPVAISSSTASDNISFEPLIDTILHVSTANADIHLASMFNQNTHLTSIVQLRRLYPENINAFTSTQLQPDIVVAPIWSSTQYLADNLRSFSYSLNRHAIRFGFCLKNNEVLVIKVCLSLAIEVLGVFTLQALDCIPINCLAPHQLRGFYRQETFACCTMLLVLTPDGRLALHLDSARIASITRDSIKPIVALRDTVSDRVTLQFVDGSMHRITLPFFPKITLISQVFQTLASQIDQKVSAAPQHHIFCSHAFDVLVFILRTFLSSRDAGKLEWEAFASTVLAFAPLPTSNSDRPPSLEEEDDWKYLLSCQKVTIPSRPMASLASIPIDEPLLGHGPCILSILHLQSEFNKLNSLSSWDQLSRSIPLLHALSRALNWQAYSLYYELSYPSFPSAVDPLSEAPLVALDCKVLSAELPPNIVSWVLTRSYGLNDIKPFPSCSSISTSQLFVAVLEKMFPLPASKSKKNLHEHYEHIVELMASSELKEQDISQLPFGFAVAIKEVLSACRELPPKSWSSAAFSLVGREDLVAQAMPYAHANLFRKSTVLKQGLNDTHSLKAEAESYSILNNSVCAIRFGIDKRLEEVERILSSSNPPQLRLPESATIGDHELLDELQGKLLQVVQRTMSLSVGRGMLVLNTHSPIVTQSIKVPTLCLSGASKYHNLGIVNLKDPATVPQIWPNFHNGVAAALRLERPSGVKSDTSWIAFHRRPDSRLTDEYAGFLFGLGLLGHLADFPTFTLCDFLSNSHETTSIALLLGLSCNKRGTMDAFMSKMLSIHVHGLMPSTSVEVGVTPLVQNAALVAVGLLYQGTCHRRTAEVLCKEIGRRPAFNVDIDFHRESHSLAAGLALGMVLLGQGPSQSESDTFIIDMLFSYIEGGRHSQLPEQPNTHRIKETNMINTDTTTAGSLMALTLMFLRSKDVTIVTRLQIFDSIEFLENTRPDFLLLRLFSLKMILWDTIEASKAWLDSCIPSCLKPFDFKFKKSKGLIWEDTVDVQGMKQAHLHIMTGACLAMAFRFAGSSNDDAFRILLGQANQIVQEMGVAHSSEGIGRTMLEYCLNTLCIAIGLLMCGSGNVHALRFLRSLYGRINSDLTYGNHMATSMAIGLVFLGGARCSVGSSDADIAALLVALFPRFPHTPADNQYHLQALRHLYVLASRPQALTVVDIDSKLPSFLPLRLSHHSDGQPHADDLMVIAPCIIPNLHSFTSVQSMSKRYWPVEIDLHRHKMVDGVIFVKRKAGHIAYDKDREALLSLHGNILSECDHNPSRELLLARALSANPLARAFDSVAPSATQPSTMLSPASPIQQLPNTLSLALPWTLFAAAALHESIANETPEALETIMQAYIAVQDLEKAMHASSTESVTYHTLAKADQLRLLIAIESAMNTNDMKSMLKPEFLEQVRLQCDDLMHAQLSRLVTSSIPSTNSDTAASTTPTKDAIARRYYQVFGQLGKTMPWLPPWTLFLS